MSTTLKISSFPGSRQKVQRLGRGTSSGRGHTSGRGNKGQNARAGAKFRLGEQTDLLKQMPKLRGFTPIATSEYELVTLSDLDALAKAGKTEITPELLVETGIADVKRSGIKVLANGTIESKITLSVHKCSKQAKAAIEKAGGSVTIL